MSNRSDGRLMCKRGHEQADFIEEEAEGIMEGSTRRRTKSLKRETKSERRRKQRVYGGDAQFLIIQGMQYILKLQATMLVENEGAPEALIETVRKLWLLYVSELDLVKTYAVDGEAPATEPGQTQATASESGTRSAPQSQSRGDYGVDTSLDFLLSKIDDDMARDRVEMLEFEQQVRGVSEPADVHAENDGTEDAHSDGGGDSGNDVKAGAGRSPASRRAHRPAGPDGVLLAHIEAFPRMEFLPAILYLACVWLRLPVSCADLYYLMADERIPYVSAHLHVPVEIVTRLGDNVVSIFVVPHSPGAGRLQQVASAFETFYKNHHSIAFPSPDVPLVLLSVLRRLDLSLEVYPMVMRVLEVTDKHTGCPGRQRYQTQLNAMTAIAICLKLHYGLDEVERVAGPGGAEAELDLPPLRDFLEKWRRDWARELSVGVVPFLTAYGEPWEQAFAAHFRRTMTRPYAEYMPVLKAAFRALGPKYRQAVESLAADRELSAEEARRLLPPDYARGFAQAEAGAAPLPLERTEQVRAERMRRKGDGTAAVAAQIDPLHLSALFLPIRSDQVPERRYSSIAEPFDNHPEIQLQRGEQYFALVTRQKPLGAPGYMIPVLGLVLARCATILGCTQETLIRRMSAMEAGLAGAMGAGN
ncbi:hypothetical protein LPJ61_001592 [Coemansia biformis]|uniref:Uncharacterized protein n=1 Tax=Coemansia biformis TaxID=1286918 RepID=A0A9W7YE11_9FUNG|nr:hypothetical protein LPJ61_001592 [Coemansia biformis]